MRNNTAFISLLITALEVSAAEPAKIAYLAKSRYDMQNAFISNLFTQFEESEDGFSYELVEKASETEIRACLTDGSCMAAANYGELYVQENQEGYDSISLPILDDPVLSVTLPQYGQVVGQSIYVVVQWLAGCFAYFVIFALLITRCEKCKKPERADIRTTPLSVAW